MMYTQFLCLVLYEVSSDITDMSGANPVEAPSLNRNYCPTQIANEDRHQFEKLISYNCMHCAGDRVVDIHHQLRGISVIALQGTRDKRRTADVQVGHKNGFPRFYAGFSNAMNRHAGVSLSVLPSTFTQAKMVN